MSARRRMYGEQEKVRVPLLYSRNLLLGPRYPFHRRFFPPAPLVVARAERDRIRCLVGVSAEVGRASYEQSSVVRK